MVNFILELIQKCHKYLDKGHMQSPKQKWQRIYDLAGSFADAIGITAYSTLKVYWFSYISDVMGFFYLSTTLYTVWFYFNQGEYLRGLQATCAIGIMITCLIVQIQSITSTRFKLNDLFKSGGKFIYIDGDDTSKYKVVREKLIDEFIRDFVVLMILMSIAMFMFGLPPLYLLIFRRARITFLGLELPFFEKDSDIGFIVNLTMQAMLAVLGTLGMLAIEIGQILIHHVIASMPHLIHVDIEEMGEELGENGMSFTAKVQLREILLKVQDFERFGQRAIDISYWRCFVGPFLFTYSIGFSFLGQYFLGYPSGYGCAVGNYVLLFICCHLGERMEASKEHFTEELFNMPWYLLPASSQRGVCCAIHKIQNAGSLKIGPFAILNMKTAADLTKSIYRFCMLLYRLFN